MTLIADSSSLILLAKINLITQLLERNEIIIPKAVYEETVKGKEKGMYDALLIEKLVAEKKIKVVKVEKKIREMVKRIFGLYAGECEALALALKKKLAIITDDKKCLNASKSAYIEFMTTPDIVVAMFQKGKISKREALNAFDALEEFGWYEKSIIKKFIKLIK